MMTTQTDTLNEQIINQLTGETDVEVFFPDTTFTGNFSFFQHDGCMFVTFPCCPPKRIPADLFNELVEQFTDEQEFNTNPEVIRSTLKHDEFHDRYCHNLEPKTMAMSDAEKKHFSQL